MKEPVKQKKLLGEVIEDVLNAVGADKVAKTIEKVTRKPCGCQKRKVALNNLHKRMMQNGAQKR